MAFNLGKKKFALFTLIFQAVFLILFSIFAEYDNQANAVHFGRNISKNDYKPDEINSVKNYYPMFQDVQAMMFLGFGFLMTFLKKYGFGSIGLNMMLCAVIIQWATLLNGLTHSENNGKFVINIESMLGAEFTLATVLISFGAVLGKISPLQLLVVGLLEVPFMVGNEILGRKLLKAVDVGDSMFVHTFGAYFGLAVTAVVTNHAVERAAKNKEGSVYHSDIFAMIGTLVLWIYWPSFNGGTAPGDDQHRAVINTFYALAASTVATFIVSSLLENGKFNMVHVQNATLAGGVAVGASADLMLYPAGALFIGIVAGTISTIGYVYLTPLLNSKNIHDTCGVHNLHGMPGIIGALASAVATLFVTELTYGNSMYSIFEAMRPYSNETLTIYNRDQEIIVDARKGYGRSPYTQAGFQLICLGCTLVISIIGGILTGFILRLKFWDNLKENDLFDDSRFWEIPDGFPGNNESNEDDGQPLQTRAEKA